MDPWLGAIGMVAPGHSNGGLVLKRNLARP